MSIGSTAMSFSSLTPYTHHPKAHRAPALPGNGKDTGTKPVLDPAASPATTPAAKPAQSDFAGALQTSMLRARGPAPR